MWLTILNDYEISDNGGRNNPKGKVIREECLSGQKFSYHNWKILNGVV